MTYLKGALEPGVPVCLITTACYSGWASLDLNTTTMIAAATYAMNAMADVFQTHGRHQTALAPFVGSVFAVFILETFAQRLFDGGQNQERE